MRRGVWELKALGGTVERGFQEDERAWSNGGLENDAPDWTRMGAGIFMAFWESVEKVAVKEWLPWLR